MAGGSWKLEKITEGIIRTDASISLAELYDQIHPYRLPVEPLSSKQPLGDFILEGGWGYYALREGPMNAKLFRVRCSATGGSFEYGLDYSTLYHAAYPLHRIIGAGGNTIAGVEVKKVEEITIPIQQEEKPFVIYEDREVGDLHLPPEATNALFVNDFGAEIMGLEKSGMVVTYSSERMEGTSRDDAWERRFVEDELPQGHHVLKLLTTRSRVPGAFEVFTEHCKGLFLALFCHIGVLLVMSGDQSALDQVGQPLLRKPLTFSIRLTAC